MSSSRAAVDYDALEATTAIEDITNDEYSQEILRSLRDDDGDVTRLCICDEAYDIGDYRPESSEELDWLGHFAKKSTHLDEFGMCESGAFNKCSQQSIDGFFEDIGKCNRIRKFYFHCINDLPEIIRKLDPAIKNNNITHCTLEECGLRETDVNHIFAAFRDMTGLEELSIDGGQHDLDDGIMAGCIPALAACKGMRKLKLISLNLSTGSSAALSAVFPRMTALQELNLDCNIIGNVGAEVLVRGLADCKHLHSLRLQFNEIGDDGLAMLIQGLPTSVDTLDLTGNEITLARQLPLLKFKVLILSYNTLSTGGPGIIAASLANPECRLEVLHLFSANIGDGGVAVVAESLRSNQRLTQLTFDDENITERGWNAFFPILCNPASINATHGSNHTLQHLGGLQEICHDVRSMLALNAFRDKSRVAARKILRAHRHLDMRPLFDRELDLLPHAVAWLERFAKSRLRKLSSIFEFVRAMPVEVVDGLLGKKKGGKRRHNSSVD